MKKEIILAARGEKKADLLLKNARYVNVYSNTIETGDIGISNGVFMGSGAYEAENTIDLGGTLISPGFVDAHVHIESSMTSVTEFARCILARGTTTIIADPHEIANVMGIAGIRYMIDSGKDQPMNVYFSLPSCVPATNMETSGARLEAKDLVPLIKEKSVVALAEMMNYPGVIFGEPDVLAKIQLAQTHGKPVDGHAPGLKGLELNAYVSAGISSDHECTTPEEAIEKLKAGMHIMVREGTGAKNLEALLPMVSRKTCHRMMWCTDDRHPHDLIHEGHIDHLVRQAVQRGLDPIVAIRMATINPAEYFGLNHIGAIAPGRQADFLIIENLENLSISHVYVAGRQVAEQEKILESVIKPPPLDIPETMNVEVKKIDLSITADGEKARIIEIVPNQLITRELIADAVLVDKTAVSDIRNDILKIAVIERHQGTGHVGLGFVKGFGLKRGALASSVAHDSHNIIVVGTNDNDMKTAMAAVADMKGGLVAACNGNVDSALPLPIAGLMSPEPVEKVRDELDQLLEQAIKYGCGLHDPFMTLSFLALPVIPDLKITDLGLVDVKKFETISLFI